MKKTFEKYALNGKTYKNVDYAITLKIEIPNLNEYNEEMDIFSFNTEDFELMIKNIIESELASKCSSLAITDYLCSNIKNVTYSKRDFALSVSILGEPEFEMTFEK